MKTQNIVKQWMAAANRFEKELLAEYAKTTVPTLQQVAGGYRTKGKVHCGLGLAMRLEFASRQVQKEHNKHLPILPAADLCPRLNTITSITE